MKKICVQLDQETYDLIKNLGLQELLRHHPELIKTQITINKIVYHAIRYYVEN